jgi:hypothetical protein
MSLRRLSFLLVMFFTIELICDGLGRRDRLAISIEGCRPDK